MAQNDTKSFLGKSIRLWTAIMIVYALLVSIHKGEFWPFSIYPMFSQAGQTWVRALTRDVTDVPDSLLWTMTDREDALPGKPFPLKLVHTHRNDLANFIKRSGTWDKNRKQGLRSLFSDQLNSRKLLVVWVEGKAKDSTGEEEGAYNINYIPFAYLSSDTTLLNPYHHFHNHW